MGIKTGCSLLDFGQPLRKSGKRLPCEVMHAENAELREDVDRLIQAVEDLHDVSLEDRLVQLENDNAKLRELTADLYTEYRFARRRMKYCVVQHEERMREIEGRMRELGIEVADAS